MNQLSLHILDLAQNSIRANARLVEIKVTENPDQDRYQIEITDDGEGMTEEQLALASNPFYTSRTTRKVGMGLALIRQNVEMSGGHFQMSSKKGIGTELMVSFGFHHLDRPAMGDIAGTLVILANNEKKTDFVYGHKTHSGEYQFDTREVKRSLDNIPLSNPQIQNFLMEMIRENLEQIQISE